MEGGANEEGQFCEQIDNRITNCDHSLVMDGGPEMQKIYSEIRYNRIFGVLNEV